MASLERRNETYRVVFRHAGTKHAFSLDTGDRKIAEALRGGVEKTLMLVSQGLLDVPDDCDFVEFVRAGGKAVRPVSKPAPTVTTFAALRDAYVSAKSNGVIESNSLEMIRLHLRHLARTYGEGHALTKLTLSDVQRHIDRRLAEKFRGRAIGPTTVRKEVSAFRAMWAWGAATGMVTGLFPARGLLYPKTDAKEPFATLAEVERRLNAGGVTAAERGSLAESLYLRREEIAELLDHVRQHAVHPWIFPLVATAAHTGARRSELVRIEVTDVDLTRGALLVREKKRSRKQRTTRHVSLTPFLQQVIAEWLAVHPGGRFLFCRSGYVSHSRTRSPLTGYQAGANRPTTSKQRTATLLARPPVEVSSVTKNEALKHFKRTLTGSRWEIVRGFHVLRHSFISCLAAAGVDQRIIDEMVGHSTDEQRRYRHLIPDVKQRAISSAFG